MSCLGVEGLSDENTFAFGASHNGILKANLKRNDEHVRQVLICTADKNLSQCVVSVRVVQLDRRRDILRDEAGVVAKFGVKPQSIPDYLAVVGDSADGFRVCLDGAQRLRLVPYLSTPP
jgi:hypothetical protein